ncbi:MAG: signal peptidase I [Pirellulales bacterium]
MTADEAATPEIESPPPAVPATDSVREVLDFVVMVLVLLLLYRGFGAEAFVIPTGSMAPTLMGYHKDLRCANCGFAYQVNASTEVEPAPTTTPGDFPPGQSPAMISACTCPVCRYTTTIENQLAEPSYGGDRIIVSKSAYSIAQPRRWDVAVFRYPAEATTNFIKRLVGLPGETVKISNGDVFTRPTGASTFAIARKPPSKVLALLQVVHDNDLAVDAKYPARDASAAWAVAKDSTSDAVWTTDDGGKTFVASSDKQGDSQPSAWLRFRHRPATYEQWQAVSPAPGTPAPVGPPQLVSDFTAYNTNHPSQFRSHQMQGSEADIEALGLHWVGDLALEFHCAVLGNTGSLQLELVEGGRRFRCQIELSTGLATLSINDLDSYLPTAQTIVHGPGQYKLRLANIDDQLLLWVQDELVDFHTSTAYQDLGNIMPTSADLSPAGISVADARLRVDRLRILRDNYYVAASGRDEMSDYVHDPLFIVPAQNVGNRGSDSARLASIMSDPGLWPQVFSLRRAVEFRLGRDEFLMLGDNSSRSKDSRFWLDDPSRRDAPPHVVPARLMIGQAEFIYWPHSWNRTSRDGTWFPAFPNLERMGLVR